MTERKVTRKVVGVKEQVITTSSGQKLIRRVTTIEMPNGKFRHPVDYFDAEPHTVMISPEELERVRIPVYERLIP